MPVSTVGRVWIWVWGALVALGVGIGRASGTNYFTARRRLFFTSRREHALISSIGDSNRRQRRETSVEKLYYIRCKRDGSWLSAESATFRLVPKVGNPARLSLMHANTQFGCDQDGSAYQAIDCTKPLHEYVTEWLDQRGPLDFDALFRHVKAHCPFDLQRFEMSAMLNTMLRRGDIELEPTGLTFKKGEHLDECAVCGAVLESRGDCSNAACWSHANIAHEILMSAKARKTLSTTCTGGGFDYISRVLWDNGPEMILHAQGEEPASPDTLSETCEVWLFPTADWSQSYDRVLRFYFDTAVQAMDFMGGFEMAKEGF